MVAEVDILKAEGVHYPESLRENGVLVILKEYKGAPHMVMGMGAVIESEKVLVQDVIDALTGLHDDSQPINTYRGRKQTVKSRTIAGGPLDLWLFTAESVRGPLKAS